MRFDALGMGEHVVEGTIDVDAATVPFTVTTGVTPWGIPMVTALLVGGGLLLRWWLARSHHREQIPHAEADEPQATLSIFEDDEEEDRTPAQL